MSRTVPAPVFETAGNLVQSAHWNAGPKAMGDFYLSPPMFRGHQSIAQSCPNSSYVALSLDVTDVDTENGHSNVTNNSRYTCQVAGWYWVDGFAAFGVGGSMASTIQVYMALNSTGGTPNRVFSLEQTIVRANNDFGAVSGSGMLKMAVGDYLEVYCAQASGGTINTAPNTDLCPTMNVVWMHV